MRKREKASAANKRTKGRTAIYILCACVLLLAAIAAVGGVLLSQKERQAPPAAETSLPTQTQATAPEEIWETGYIAAMDKGVLCYDRVGVPLRTLLRGTELAYTVTPDGRTKLRVGSVVCYLQEEAYMVADPSECVPAHTQYVRTAVNLRDAEGKLMDALAEKGAPVRVTGCDDIRDGIPHMYRVELGEAKGYIMPWYLTGTQEEALANYDAGHYATHADRGNRYGGGGAADLDYYPREKGPIPGNSMPEECRTLYLVNWCLENVDQYIAIAQESGINAFVVDIVDGGSVGYGADVMNRYCPTGAAAAQNSVEEYQAAIMKLKSAGYYVIGRITTFNDRYFVQDHPEYAISDHEGNPLRLSAEYWPSPYNRTAWQYKVDLAVEAVELMGFHEIQFDYVRFPDSTSRYESAGTIDFRNTYGETKAQAIQRFLMYATDILHEHGAYVSADVYGESAYTYVTAYGQYWPAISNVADVISGMPYPDHFSASGDWRPWEHPYDTLHSWGKQVMRRQEETATPAGVRTWIQAYNAIREPYNSYGPDQVFAQIKGLRDAGCTGGYMTWNPFSSIDKYKSLLPAFAPPEETDQVPG